MPKSAFNGGILLQQHVIARYLEQSQKFLSEKLGTCFVSPFRWGISGKTFENCGEILGR